VFIFLGVCWSSPESGDLWYRLGSSKETICGLVVSVRRALDCKTRPRMAGGEASTTSPQSAINSPRLLLSVCTGACRNLATCSTHQGVQKDDLMATGRWQARAAYSIAETRARMAGGLWIIIHVTSGVLVSIIVYIHIV